MATLINTIKCDLQNKHGIKDNKIMLSRYYNNLIKKA